jgi:hypothetical protein
MQQQIQTSTDQLQKLNLGAGTRKEKKSHQDPNLFIEGELGHQPVKTNAIIISKYLIASTITTQIREKEKERKK